MSTYEGRAKLEAVGRECVREIIQDGEEKGSVVLIGSLPKKGFPRGLLVGEHTDGKPIRMYSATKLLAAVQNYMRLLDVAKGGS